MALVQFYMLTFCDAFDVSGAIESCIVIWRQWEVNWFIVSVITIRCLYLFFSRRVSVLRRHLPVIHVHVGGRARQLVSLLASVGTLRDRRHSASQSIIRPIASIRVAFLRTCSAVASSSR